MVSSFSPLTDGPFERAMWLWGRDALLLGQLHSPTLGGTRFLDVGCGSGMLAITAAAMGFDVTAMDISVSEIARLDAKIAAAHRESPTAKITAYVGDGQTLQDVADGSVDVVASCFGMFFFPDRVAAWTSALRVLVPRGRLLTTSWDATTANAQLFRYLILNAIDREKPPSPTTPNKPNRSMQAPSFQAELEENGFVDVHVHTLSHPIVFTSGQELIQDVLGSEWAMSVVGHKDEASIKRAVLDFVQLVLDGEDPFAEEAKRKIHIAQDVPAEQHPLWTRPFALPGLGHVAIATKP